MKTARQELDIINAYEETGSLRAAAELCGTTHKTVKRVLERRAAGQEPGRRRSRPKPVGLAEPFTDLIFAKVKSTDGRITAKEVAAGSAGGRVCRVGADVSSGGGRAEAPVAAGAAGVSAVDPAAG